MLTLWLLLAFTALIALSVAIDLITWAQQLPQEAPSHTRRNTRP